MRYCLAIDIGASSGRHIVGWMENGRMQTEEVYRFANGVRREKGHLVWDVETLFREVKEGIAAAKARFATIASLSIDTWGVDYVLLKGDREVLPVYAYRDGRTEAVVSLVHRRMPFSELYRRTGCQFQSFNSLDQLYADKISGRLDGITGLLMLPEYLLWKLCGAQVREYTNATTTGLVSTCTGEYDNGILEAMDFPRQLFPKLSRPGKVLGEYEGIKCVLCATHDTASAVEGIPMEGNQPYLSSGTWSLLGVKTSRPLTGESSQKGNWSNEGGVGYNRYQKNIMGMWLVNQLRKELCNGLGFAEIVQAAQQSDCDVSVDANAPGFLAPESMKDAFDAATGGALKDVGGYFRCAFRSLAQCYGQALQELEINTGRSFEKLYVVGGGAKNVWLNRLTQEATGKTVIALPIEATALGNLKIQMEAVQ